MPASGYQNTTVNITNLAGLGFQAGATVQLQRGGTVINATNVVVTSATKITCTFSLGAQPAGSYDVVVRNPDGQEGIINNGFTVNADPGQCGAGGGSSLGLIGVMMGLLSLAGAGGLRSRSKRMSA